MTSRRCEVAIVGSGFAGSLLARILATLGYDVVLLEKGSHPRFAIGESSTPFANLCLERLSLRFGLPDLYQLATHGRWLRSHADLGTGLKRGFTFYRHYPGQPLVPDELNQERLLVAASPNDDIADTHWVRADVDHYFVRKAIEAGVDYRERTAVALQRLDDQGALLEATSADRCYRIEADFLIDASGPAGFLARSLPIRSELRRTRTRTALVFSHFRGVKEVEGGVGFERGPYPDDWSAMHHIIDEGWMYSLRFDHGVVSAGFSITPRGMRALKADGARPEALWRELLAKYPTIGWQFGEATPLFPIRFVPKVQHRLARASGDRWLVLPHAFAFVDPLFSTGIAWSLRSVERIALGFAERVKADRRPTPALLDRYHELVAAEADQIDRLVAGAYDAMASFDLFAAHSMIYFVTVSFGEIKQRLLDGTWAWDGFLGVTDPLAADLPAMSSRRLRAITSGGRVPGSASARRDYVDWVATAVGPRNVAGLADRSRRNLYPVDLDILIERHGLLELDLEAVMAALPRLRGMNG